MDEERLINPDASTEDIGDTQTRPQTLEDFAGQRQVCDNLRVFVEAARGRSEALDHVLLFGPPGLGKTTLAQIVARELGVGFRATSGPVIAKADDLAAILTNLKARDVLFIDGIHRLSPAVEEILYPAVEDFQVDPVTRERRVWVVHREGSVQSEVRIGHVGTDRATPDYFSLSVGNLLFGGSFTSQIGRAHV